MKKILIVLFLGWLFITPAFAIDVAGDSDSVTCVNLMNDVWLNIANNKPNYKDVADSASVRNALNNAFRLITTAFPDANQRVDTFATSAETYWYDLPQDFIALNRAGLKDTAGSFYYDLVQDTVPYFEKMDTITMEAGTNWYSLPDDFLGIKKVYWLDSTTTKLYQVFRDSLNLIDMIDTIVTTGGTNNYAMNADVENISGVFYRIKNSHKDILLDTIPITINVSDLTPQYYNAFGRTLFLYRVNNSSDTVFVRYRGLNQSKYYYGVDDLARYYDVHGNKLFIYPVARVATVFVWYYARKDYYQNYDSTDHARYFMLDKDRIMIYPDLIDSDSVFLFYQAKAKKFANDSSLTGVDYKYHELAVQLAVVTLVASRESPAASRLYDQAIANIKRMGFYDQINQAIPTR